jgi:hypothetical protein
VIVGAKLAASPDATKKSAGAMLMIYYIGRLDGRSPEIDNESLMIREIEKMTAATFLQESERCGKALSAKGKEITRIGEDLARLEK